MSAGAPNSKNDRRGSPPPRGSSATRAPTTVPRNAVAGGLLPRAFARQPLNGRQKFQLVGRAALVLERGGVAVPAQKGGDACGPDDYGLRLSPMSPHTTVRH